ncbi:LIC_13387 family protein [Amycolatopsis albispora]|uniref:DUF4064 domain-containing protein n=1 Tax=Amycolatopsis albispora TaxID=1804986 RepID=A0A344LIW9_9PSEU|nr:hypothetical protein [Amycolatopsis albispora]AXB47993.1 hypothetical protein A4R43_40725 [Amycolatopsis albispora]
MKTFRIGAWAWIATGAGHLATAALLAAKAATPEADRAMTAMREYGIELLGLQRSLADLDRGMSLVMGVALIFAGAVCLFVPEASRKLAGLALAASVVALGLSAWLLPLPPIVLFAVACIAFGWSLAKPQPRR